MSTSQATLQIAELSKNFQTTCAAFETLLESSVSQESTQVLQKLRAGLQEYKEQGVLQTAFIGQYSAGKSTIISALTGQRDIRIDADIATDSTTSYDWSGIKVIDTPGLFTDRLDHDEITYETISKSDLLIFCLTHMLFDTVTVENFKKLAYEKAYRWKMMLVINKMSAAAGDDEEKLKNYRYSLVEALKPYTLDEFPTYFIDAKDYCEGVDENDDFLIEVSRFDTFIHGLNDFVKTRASLTRLDTPIRIALACVDDAQLSFSRAHDSDQDIGFLEILSRLSRRIEKERESLRTKVKGLILEMSAKIIEEGYTLAGSLEEQNFSSLQKESEIKIRQYYEQSGEKLEQYTIESQQSLSDQLDEELKSTLIQEFIAQLDFDKEFEFGSPEDKQGLDQVQKQVQSLSGFAEKAGLKLVKSATRTVVPTAKASQGFLRSMDVAGSELHQVVYQVGKFVGFKFKPFQAVNFAKGIANVAKVVGPLLAVASIAVDLHEQQREKELEQQKAAARREISSQFKSIAVDLDRQMKLQLGEFEAQSYDQLQESLSYMRQQMIAEQEKSSTYLGSLTAIRSQLVTILNTINQIAKSPDTTVQ